VRYNMLHCVPVPERLRCRRLVAFRSECVAVCCSSVLQCVAVSRGLRVDV